MLDVVVEVLLVLGGFEVLVERFVVVVAEILVEVVFAVVVILLLLELSLDVTVDFTVVVFAVEIEVDLAVVEVFLLEVVLVLDCVEVVVARPRLYANGTVDVVVISNPAPLAGAKLPRLRRWSTTL